MSEGGERRWTRIFRPDPRAEVEEELAHHLAERIRDGVSRGLDEEAARQAALARLGDLNDVRAECTQLLKAERRTEARREWMKFSVLDFKLGLRMLARYPGLTVVGGLAIAFAIWVAASTFELINQIVSPRVPLPDGDRIVAIRNLDLQSRNVAQTSPLDFARWREEVESVADLGAYYRFTRNLTVGENSPAPIGGVATSASAFRVGRVAPVLGRVLVEADEQPGAPGVVVIGYRVWQSGFEGDPSVLGKMVRLGSEQLTVVGVMPADYGFPLSQSLWIPLRINANEKPGAGPPISVFGRLAAGVSLGQAQAELRATGQRAARDYRETHEHLRPEVVPFAKSLVHFSGLESALARSINLFLVMLLALVCANVALLVFARAAARESEIAVRNALGASRGRIITQLFAEALVLVGFGAALGLAAAGYGLRVLLRFAQSELPQAGQLAFWTDWRLAPATAFYVVGLTLLGAGIVGVVPALKVTRGLQTRLREAAAGGGGLKFGGLWTAIIVTQVALTLAFPATGYFLHYLAKGEQSAVVGFNDDEFLVARLDLDREIASASPAARFRAAYDEIERRLQAEPGVVAVTFGDRLPRMSHSRRPVELDVGGAVPLDPSAWERWVAPVSVDLEFFDALQTPMLSGRAFNSGDLLSSQRAVIVNQAFVNNVLGGRNAIGRRVRFASREGGALEEAEPWQVIVGVTADMEVLPNSNRRLGRIYRPVAPEQAEPLHMAIHVKGEPMALVPRLREIAAAVDPAVRVNEPRVLGEVDESDDPWLSLGTPMIVMVSTVALVLSLAGIYAVMSFTVARRTREIGVRIALGANRRRLLLAVFARPLRQLTIGIVAGTALVIGLALIAYDVHDIALSLRVAALVTAYSIAMTAVCMLACIVPTRRALRVEPMDSLRAEA